jgi:YVTN family beta-propeller protein
VYEPGTYAGTMSENAAVEGEAYDPANGYVYVCVVLADRIDVVSGTSVVASITGLVNPYDIVYNPVNGYLYTDLGNNQVDVISSTTVIGSVSVGAGDLGMAVNTANGAVYVADVTAGDVSVLSGLSSVGSVILPYPTAVAYDSGDGDIYVAEADNAQLGIIHGLTSVGTVGLSEVADAVAYDTGTGGLYAVESGSNQVQIVAGDAVVSTVPTGLDPNWATYDPLSGYVYVPNDGSANVTVLSGDTIAGTLIVGSEPVWAAVNLATGYVYITNFDQTSPSISVFSTLLQVGLAGGEIVDVGPANSGSVNVGESPVAVALDGSNGLIYSANALQSNVSLVSGTAVLANVGVGGEFPDGLAYDSGSGDMYVANGISNTVSIVQGSSLIGHVNVGSDPIGIADVPGYDEVLVANAGGNNVSIIDTATNTVAGEIGVGDGPFDAVYVPTQGTAYVTNSLSNNVTPLLSVGNQWFPFPSINVGTYPEGIAWDPSDQELYVADSGSNAVSVISGSAVVATIPVGTSPFGVAYDPYTNEVYVSNENSGNVSVIDGTTVVANLVVGPDPTGLAYDPANQAIYVADYAGSTLTLLALQPVSALEPSYTLDQGQGLEITASLVGDGTGPGFQTEAASPSSGLPCELLTLTPTQVGAWCDGQTVGTYTVTLMFTDTSGLSVWTSLTLEVFGDPSVTSPSASRSSSDVGQSVSFTASASGGSGTYPTYAWTSPAGLGCAPTSTSVLSCLPTGPVASGTVSVVATDSDDMASSAATTSFTVHSDPTFTGVSATRGAVDVGGLTTLAALLVGGSGSTVFSWAGLPSGCLSSSTPSLACSPAASGSFAVVAHAIDSNGWNATSATLGLTVYPALGVPAITLSRGSLDDGQSVTFSAAIAGGSGAYTYAWSGLPTGCAPANLSSIVCVPQGVSTTTSFGVSLTVSDSAGSSQATPSTSMIVVSPDPTLGAPSASAAALDVGQSTTIGVVASVFAPGSPVYSWQGLPAGCLSVSSTTLACSPTALGTYTIVAFVQDANGANVSSVPCTLVVSSALGAATLSASRAALDVGQTTVLSATGSGGTGSYRYAWTGLPSGCQAASAASLTCVPTAAGSAVIHVWVNDTNGASSTSTATLIISPLPSIAGMTSSAARVDVGQWINYTTVVSGGSGGLVYAWTGLPTGCTSTAATADCQTTAMGQGSVDVTVADSNGGAATSSSLPFTVYPDVSVGAVSASRSALDAGQTVTFQVSPTGGSGGYLYAWSGLPEGCASADAPVLECAPTAAGTSSVWVVVEDSDDYSAPSTAASITVSATLVAGTLTLAPGSIDLGQSAQLTASSLGGSGGLSYAWSLPAGCASSSAATLSCTPSAAGAFWASATISDSNGASVLVGPVALTVVPALGTPTVSASDTTPQAGSVVVLSVSVSGGTGPLSYVWSGLPTGCASADSPSLSCVPTSAGSSSVTVTVTDAAGVAHTSAAVELNVAAVPGAPAAGFTTNANGLEWALLGLALLAVLLAIVAILLASRRTGEAASVTSPSSKEEAAEKPSGAAESDSEPAPAEDGASENEGDWNEETEKD